MGLLDKLKNALFEEEEIEVEEVERSKKKENVKEEKEKPEHKILRRRSELPKEEPTETKPISSQEHKDFKKRLSSKILDDTDEIADVPEPIKEDTIVRQSRESLFAQYSDDDFKVEHTKKMETVVVDEPVAPVEQKEEVPVSSILDDEDEVEKVLYKGTGDIKKAREPYDNPDYHPLYGGVPEDKAFRPTPIISPIFGILDKNYSKDDIVDKTSVDRISYSSTKITIDKVREKAYGGLDSDLGISGEDSINKEVETESNLDDNLLYDMSDTTTTPVVDKVTMADAEEYFNDLGLEYNVDYKDAKSLKQRGQHVSKDQIVSDISSNNDESDDIIEVKNEESIIEAPKEKKTRESKIEIKPMEEDDISEDTKSKDEKLEDNLFDLIDSMYDDKEDDA